MRTSEFPLATLREAPSEAESVSHRLMLRAGLIRQVASGIYTWMPLGLRVVRNIEQIVREEMNAAGACEVLMPSVQPAELWQRSGRWNDYGADLLRLVDRHQRDFCLGPTHEEIITDIACRELHSYRQLPLNLYQIQTKFRDEIRPRFGVMRAREFIMKDAYSFHADTASLQQTYDRMYRSYSAIFDRLGLNYRAVLADSGDIGGETSHEFQVLAASGEDRVAVSDSSDYAANLERATRLLPTAERAAPAAALQELDTGTARTIDELCAQLQVRPQQVLKTLLVQGAKPGTLVALVLRGDHQLNAARASALPAVATPLILATDEEIGSLANARTGNLGPVGLNMPVIADLDAAAMANFICGANRPGQHLDNCNWGRDLPEPITADIRNVTDGDPSPDGAGALRIVRGIEVGHIFQLGDKYSTSMGLSVSGPDGRDITPLMGCYGIGITRILAAAIEQCHDDRGILWPPSIAPAQLVLVLLNPKDDSVLTDTAEQLYTACQQAGISTLLDDRDERPGIKFADAELIGFPHRLTISTRNLENGQLEYQHRASGDTEAWPVEQAMERLQALFGD